MPEKKDGNPKSGFDINPIQEPEHPYFVDQIHSLDTRIQHDPGLKALLQALQNPGLNDRGFFEMVESWNEEHVPWTGFPVQREFNVNGRVLTVKMDREGNVQLKGRLAR